MCHSFEAQCSCARTPSRNRSSGFRMDTQKLISLICGLSALESRGDGIGRPLDERTKAAVSAFRNAMLRRLISCHLAGANLSIDTESIISLNDAMTTLEREGDGYIVGLSQDDQRLSAELRGALIERVKLHPGGSAIASLMSRLAPVPPPAPSPAPAPTAAPAPVMAQPAAPERRRPAPVAEVVNATPPPAPAAKADAGFAMAEEEAQPYAQHRQEPAPEADSHPRMPAVA